MIRMLTICLLLTLAWVGFVLANPFSPSEGGAWGAGGQPAQPKTGGMEGGKGEPPKKTPLDKMQLPPGSIFVILEDIKEALGYPKLFWLTPEEYQKLQNHIAALENQLKSEREPPHALKLAGKVEGDYLSAEAEVTFFTKKPNVTVVLGLQGAHLTKEGDLDGQLPHLEYGDEGFVVLVGEAGRHTLRLKFEAPVGLRRSGTPGGGSERGFDLGLPGAAVTTVTLELPNTVKELRWNDSVEKKRESGRWEFAPSVKDKKINVAWKELGALPGGSLLTADSQIQVTLDDNQVVISADLFLEDLRGTTTKEWHLLLPAPDKAKVEALGPSGLFQELVLPEKKGGPYVLKLKEPTTERLHLHIQYSYVRPFPGKMAVGPFAVVGAARQHGSIVVKATSQALRGWRPEFQRHGETHPREVKSMPADPVVAAFQYWALPGVGKTPPFAKGPKGIPLEIELKVDESQSETQVEHWIHLRSVPRGTLIEATTKIKGKGLSGPVNLLKVQLPRSLAVSLTEATALNPAAFPAGLSWWPVWRSGQLLDLGLLSADFTCQGDGNPELAAPDFQRRAQIKVQVTKARDFTVSLQGKYFVPGPAQKTRLELPRLLDDLDRKVKVQVSAEENLELLPEGGTPAADKHLWTKSLEGGGRVLDLAWRPYRPEFRVTTETAVTLRELHGEVRHVLHLPLDRVPAAKPRVLLLRLPDNVQKLEAISGKKSMVVEGNLLRLVPDGKGPVVLEYNIPLPRREGADGPSTRTFTVPLIWPAAATRIDAKVRLWCEPGVVPAVAQPSRNIWLNGGPEKVVGHDSVPALNVQASGLDLPLHLRLQEPPPSKQIDVLLERVLIQAILGEQVHNYRARFIIRKCNTEYLDLEFPTPVVGTVDYVFVDKTKRHLSPLESNSNILRVKVDPKHQQPLVLDVEYHLSAAALDSEPFWQTRLYPPVFRGEVYVPRVGWQVSLATNWTPLMGGGKTVLDFHWAYRQGLLKPEPTAIWEQEKWHSASGSWEYDAQASLTFWRPTLGPVQLVQVPWQGWFLLCSGVLLVVGLGLSFASLGRLLFWLVVSILLLGILAARFLWPSVVPLVVYGCQPGAVVLVILVTVQWFLQERYRRQLVFLPGFARVKAGSSLIRSQTASRPTGTSTVDAPPAASTSGTGSSVVKKK